MSEPTVRLSRAEFDALPLIPSAHEFAVWKHRFPASYSGPAHWVRMCRDNFEGEPGTEFVHTERIIRSKKRNTEVTDAA